MKISNGILEYMICDAIEKELGYQTDNITRAGWAFLDDEAEKLVMAKIAEDYDFDNDGNIADENANEISETDIYGYLQDVIKDYESEHGAIRIGV